MRRRGRNVPATRLGRARGRRPAGVGLSGASRSGCRACLRGSSAGGGGLEVARHTVGRETRGGLLRLGSGIRGPRAVSGRSGLPKRDGGIRCILGRSTRRRAVLRGPVLGCAVLRGPVLGARLARALRPRTRDAHDDGHDCGHAGCHHDQPEPADSQDAEEADIGQQRRNGSENHQGAADNGHVEAPFDGLFHVNATVFSLGQEQPGEPVGEGHNRDEECADRHEDAYERQVPSLAGGDTRADASDDAGLSSVPS